MKAKSFEAFVLLAIKYRNTNVIAELAVRASLNSSVIECASGCQTYFSER